MDELEAVNVLLGNIGTSPIDSLTVGHPDANAAVRTLRIAAKYVQRKGLWFNTDYNVYLQPDATTKKILVRSAVSIELQDRSIIKRGDYLYNRSTQTFKFDADVFVFKIISYLDWDDLPDIAKTVALYRAGAEFVRDELEDMQLVDLLQREEAKANVELTSENIVNQQLNIFDTPRIRRARSGVRPFRSRTFFNTPDA